MGQDEFGDEFVGGSDHQRAARGGPGLETGPVDVEATAAGGFGSQVFLVVGEHVAGGGGGAAGEEWVEMPTLSRSACPARWPASR